MTHAQTPREASGEARPKTQIVIDVTTDDPEFVRNLAVTIASEVRSIVQAKSPNGETQIVVSIR